ncbi:hypothetical protein [Pseudomonas sp. NUPR-001]|uniref:hypothetical protein n=1 Tax=Pseudomonas sp. NUPR-001 TaxID=3416058 RepID=UPI003F956C07
MATADAYITAKANLRDNVKTLILVFGSIAGVMMAGTPFSGYGALAVFSTQWWVASISLLLTITLVAIALRLLLRSLQPDLSYPEALHQNFNLDGQERYTRRELSALRKEFERYKHQLLPAGINTLEELESRADDAWELYQRTGEEKDKEAYYIRHEILTDIGNWSAFTRLHFRIRTTINMVLLIGLFTLVSIAVFSSAVNAPQRPSEFATEGTIPALRPSTLTPVSLEADMSGLTNEALAVIASTLEKLRADPTAGVLIFGVLDNSAASARKRDLVNYRAHEVRQLLSRLGGVSDQRVFVIELPKSDTHRPLQEDSSTEPAVQIVLLPLLHAP